MSHAVFWFLFPNEYHSSCLFLQTSIWDGWGTALNVWTQEVKNIMGDGWRLFRLQPNPHSSTVRFQEELPLIVAVAISKGEGTGESRGQKATDQSYNPVMLCEWTENQATQHSCIPPPHSSHFIFLLGKKPKEQLDGQIKTTLHKGLNHLSLILPTGRERDASWNTATLQNRYYRSSKWFSPQYHWEQLDAQTRIPTCQQGRSTQGWDRGTHRWAWHATQPTSLPTAQQQDNPHRSSKPAHTEHTFSTPFITFSSSIRQAGITYLLTSRCPSSLTWRAIKKWGWSKPLSHLQNSRCSSSQSPHRWCASTTTIEETLLSQSTTYTHRSCKTYRRDHSQRNFWHTPPVLIYSFSLV